VKLPSVSQSTLSNGLRLVLVEDNRFPLVTVRLAFGAGTKFDPPDRPGLAEAMASLLTDGTSTRTSKQIAEEVASLGGSLTATASPDSVTISAGALSENVAKILDLAADVARNASFPAEEVSLYQQNRKQRLLDERSQSEFLAEEKLAQVVYGRHPYSVTGPTVESIDKLAPAVLTRHRDTYLAPNNAVLILLGKLPPRADTMKLIEGRFGAWLKRDVPAIQMPPPPHPKRSVTLIDRPGSVQADVHIGRQGVTRLDQDYFPLVVGNGILGGGTASRLFDDIREKRGYAYSVYSHLAPQKEAGLFTTVMQVRNEVVGDAIGAMLGHMGRMATERVSAKELSDIKNYLSGAFVMRLERQESIANQLVQIKMLGLPDDYLEKYTARIRSTEPDQILRAAGKVIAPEDASVVVVGDAKQIKSKLEKLGDVQVTPAK
jgi:predicted Zn-dependent peptidase